MTSNTYTIADLFLQALEEAGVDYMFTVLGSELSSILEAYMRRKRCGKAWPKMLHFQHEFVAISAADGYGRITGRPQCVIAHVDVGTASLGQGLHNASTGRAPMLIFAGIAPLTLNGELPGSRTEHVQWMQDVPNQSAIVSPYARYTNEIKVAEHLRTVVQRALMMATTKSAGPSYLTAARETLATPVRKEMMSQIEGEKKIFPSCHVGGLPSEAVKNIGKALLTAKDPLVITGYLGRNHNSVRKLFTLANLIPALKVHDSEFREMSFPATHPSWITKSTGADTAIQKADILLILDCDVPWIPTKFKPSPNARIFHIDIDPRKEKMQLFDFGAEGTFDAECDIALQQLCDFIVVEQRSISRQIPIDFPEDTWAPLEAAHAERLQQLESRAQPNWSGFISGDYLFAAMRRVLPRETVYVQDAVTNTTKLFEQLQLTAPGRCLGKGGAGLGWAGGAAIGVKLALARYDISERPNVKVREVDEGGVQEPLVCCVTGDGAFVFGVPTATYWAQKRLGTPFISILLNNGGWKATRQGLKDVHPDGVAAATSDEELGIDLSDDGPDYVGVAVAASNGSLWGRKVAKTDDLDTALEEAVRVVRDERRGALLEVIIG